MRFKLLFLVFLFPCFSNGIEYSLNNNAGTFLLSQNSVFQKPAAILPSIDKGNSQAKGIILKFHNWPNLTKEQLITTDLSNKGLVEKVKIKRFNTWVFEWPKSGKAVEAQRLCVELLKLSNTMSLESCEPDFLVDTTAYDYEAAAKKIIAGAKVGVANAEKAVEIAKQALSSAEEKASRIKGRMTSDPGLAVEQGRVQRAEAALQNAKKDLARATANGPNVERARKLVSRLEKLVASRKKRVENRKKWFRDTKGYVGNNQDRLVESRRIQLRKAEKWLENRKQYFKKALSKYAKYLPDEEETQKGEQDQENSVTESNVNQPVSTNQKSRDIRSCNIVSSKVGLFDNQLSDYWAQEMVGADLLKEEVKKADPIEKKIVETFDSHVQDHASKVRNIISHNGSHSVLPELKNKIGISHVHYISDILTAADRLLNKADEACNTPNSNNSNSPSSHIRRGSYSESEEIPSHGLILVKSI